MKSIHSLKRIAFCTVIGLGVSSIATADEAADVDGMNLGMFQPLTVEQPTKRDPATEAKIKLGKALYLETKLSKNNQLSCNSCHNLKTYGVDNNSTSPGHEGKRGDRNSPTSFNSALHIAQFWDGRAPDVEAQALGPIRNPIEMGMESDEAALAKLKAEKDYPKMFAAAFPEEKDPLTFKNIGRAIGAFERTLLTPSRFDAYLQGDKNALSREEKVGLKRFIETGCITCHMGKGVGGAMYQKLGLVKPYETKDLGRYNVTKNEADKFVFKVPSLRNIAETAPYLHDGSVKTLPEAVKIMGTHQLGRDLNDTQVNEIVTFLRSLTGKAPQGL